MTVKELIEELKNFNEDSQVILCADGEGNSFSPLDSLDERKYEPENTFCGNCFTEEDVESGDVEQEEFDGMDDAVVLFPVN